jgi:osmotically-inducible protein OsmY
MNEMMNELTPMNSMKPAMTHQPSTASLRLGALILALAGLGTLTACVPLVVGGAAAGALVASDRRTSGTQLEDETIELRSASRIRADFGTRVRVSVTSYNRQVLLTGEVPNAQDREAVAQLVGKVDNVDSVVNELAVQNSPTLTERSADLLVTGRIKAALLDARDLQANSVKVVTERGVAYLMGRVTAREAERITNIARAVPGVQRVVRIFENISEDELRRLQLPGGQEPGAPAPASRT